MAPIKLSWKQYHQMLRDFSTMIKDEQFDYIIPIARGGWIPALIISRQNNVRGVFSFGVCGYDDHTNIQFPQLEIYQMPPLKKLQHKKVLIIDDLVDTGRTMKAITRWLKKNNIQYKTAALYKKKGAAFVPDYYMKENKSWVVFPFEK